MSVDLSAVIAATAQSVLRAYPPAKGGLSAVLAEAQVRQAVAVAAWLPYPTALDASLLNVVGPGGSARLDWLAGVDTTGASEHETAWRTWVDEWSPVGQHASSPIHDSPLQPPRWPPTPNTCPAWPATSAG